MYFKFLILKTNIKYNSNINEKNTLFFQNEAVFLFLNDNLANEGYFAIGKKEELEILNHDLSSFDALDNFINIKNKWKFGFLTYDLKNSIEKLESNNKDNLDFPLLYFFIPNTLLRYKNGEFSLIYGNPSYIKEAKEFTTPQHQTLNLNLKPRLNKDEYLSHIHSIKKEIKQGNIYEANFCYEFYETNKAIDPFDVYHNLMPLTNAPFSSFGKFGDKYVISASPERFLKKTGNKLISEPIKGTSKRGRNEKEDLELKQALKSNKKERSENIMIVDLVRNDLSKIAKYDSVKVEELCEIYSFETVHQMISKITCEIDKNISFSDLLKATYPMGSMTGAPKISTMKIIEREEQTKRGLYSGSIGYVSPDNDFDFNVIIRTFLYNEANNYISAMVGGAITDKSNPEEEYKETLIKIEALLKAINNE